MKTIKVIYSNGDYTITKINGTKDEIEAYYIGNAFNVGITSDNLVICTRVEFLNDISNVTVEDLKEIERILNTETKSEQTIDICMRIDQESKEVEFYRTFGLRDRGCRLLDDVEHLEINTLLSFLKDNGFYSVGIRKQGKGFCVLAQAVGTYENYFSYDCETVKDALMIAKILEYKK